MHVGAGALLTVLMQSSSAALAVALTAAQGGLIGINDAAAVVIGANVGTTVKALLAALKATPNARRAAAAHVLFNLLTGAVALLLLPWMVDAIEWLRELLELEAAPAVTLALFHTAFNVLGVALMWPLAGRLTGFLARRFRTAEEDEARPRHLDETVLSVPALALNALIEEVRRTGKIALRAAERVMRSAAGFAPGRQPEQAVVAQLNSAIARFVTRLHGVSMAAESAQRLPSSCAWHAITTPWPSWRASLRSCRCRRRRRRPRWPGSWRISWKPAGHGCIARCIRRRSVAHRPCSRN